MGLVEVAIVAAATVVMSAATVDVPHGAGALSMFAGPIRDSRVWRY